MTAPLKPLRWIRRSARVWECRVIAEYSLTILARGRGDRTGFLFRRRNYPTIDQAKQAAFAFLTTELSPLLAQPQIDLTAADHPQLQRAA